ncbi:MAG: BrnT family toxin [Methylophilaceae bacterium]|nr:BrnT family toxin [Methylophilaceae bacterium]
MDIRYELNGTIFIWNTKKAASNRIKHDGISFEQASTVFFDPFFRLVEAGRNSEVRDAIIGYDISGLLLFVVHVATEGETIRIISARKATNEERRNHEYS